MKRCSIWLGVGIILVGFSVVLFAGLWWRTLNAEVDSTVSELKALDPELIIADSKRILEISKQVPRKDFHNSIKEQWHDFSLSSVEGVDPGSIVFTPEESIIYLISHRPIAAVSLCYYIREEKLVLLDPRTVRTPIPLSP